jgi:hydroxymethylpyrimidine pyrophosphatase-like HAD family hydrolase
VLYANFNLSEIWTEFTDFQLVDFSKHKVDSESIYSINLSSEDMDFVCRFLPENLHQYNTSVGAGFLMQIMHKDASKSKAVTALADYWGIKQSETVAFGDDVNDTDLLTHAGTGVAMGNAVGSVKTAADFGCEDNDNDGMAKWLESNVLLHRTGE